MRKSKTYKNYLEKEREENYQIGFEEGMINSMKESNKTLLSIISNSKYKETIKVIDLIDDIDILEDIFERGLVHLELMSELERMAKKLNDEKKEETINNKKLYEIITKSNEELNKRIDSILNK